MLEIKREGLWKRSKTACYVNNKWQNLIYDIKGLYKGEFHPQKQSGWLESRKHRWDKSEVPWGKVSAALGDPLQVRLCVEYKQGKTTENGLFGALKKRSVLA